MCVREFSWIFWLLLVFHPFQLNCKTDKSEPGPIHQKHPSAYHLPCPEQESMLHLSHESRLINCLLDRYARVTTLARPVKDSSANVVVEFGVSLIQILDFDEIKQIVTTSMWKNYVWEDQVLRWDPAIFGGVTHIRLPATALWTPDIVLYNKVTAVLPSDSGTVLTNMEVDQGNIRPKRQTSHFKPTSARDMSLLVTHYISLFCLSLSFLSSVLWLLSRARGLFYEIHWDDGGEDVLAANFFVK